MGIILGALAGAGGQAIDFADKQITQDHALEKEKYSSDLALDRAKALEIAKVELGNKERTAMVDRVQGAASQIADEKLASRKQGIDMEAQQDATGTLVGPAQDPEVARQQLESDRRGLIDKAMQDGSAGARSGDISPKDAATLNVRTEADLTRLMLGEQRTQTMAMIASGHDQTRALVAGIMAAAKKEGSTKEDRVIVHQFLGQFDRKIQENGKDIRSLRTNMDNAPKSERSKFQEQIDELTRQNKNLTSAQLTYAKEAGVKVPTSMDGETPAPTPGGDVGPPAADAPEALPAGVPPGSKQVGTSGGQPVYQSPDGKKWKVQ